MPKVTFRSCSITNFLDSLSNIANIAYNCDNDYVKVHDNTLIDDNTLWKTLLTA